MPTNTPTGAVHEVGVDEIFFSTTDAKGVIERSNDVFVRLSRSEREQLIEVPHNLVRHPEMPDGAFHAMWATLQKGQPFAAYMRNLAANGSEYDVFTTVTPLRSGGYLSVRTRPVCEELFSKAYEIYDDARATEDQAKADGADRRQAAEQGAARILDLLDKAGLPDYEAFQNTVLPAEVAGREELSAGLPARPDADGPMAQMLRAVTAFSAGLDEWMTQLDELARLGAQLRQAGERLSQAVDSPALTAQTVSALDQDDPRVAQLSQLLNLWLEMQGIVGTQATRLHDVLAQMESVIGRTRFRIALARLHATATASFIVEIIDGADGAADDDLSQGAITDLLDALEDGVTDLEVQVREHQRLTEDTTTAIAQAQRILTIPRQLLMLWTASPQASDPDLPEAAQELSRTAEHTVSTSGSTLEDLGQLAARCRELDVDEPTRELREHLTVLREALRSTASAD